jgi:hypothetical protein
MSNQHFHYPNSTHFVGASYQKLPFHLFGHFPRIPNVHSVGFFGIHKVGSKHPNRCPAQIRVFQSELTSIW